MSDESNHSAEALSGRILIVDDEAAQMKALCETLKEHGHHTTGFTSAHSALAALPGGNFDLVLTDLMMPEMNGIALLREAIKIDSNLIGIIMTGEGTITSAVEAMKAGALDYILKPFRLSVIMPVLARALAVKNLRMKNAELEQRVRERTAELEAANKELEAFCYSVSHDLRTPLRHINGYAEILVENCAAQLPEEDRAHLNQIASSARRMGLLIDDLLRLSRFGRQHLSIGPVSIRKLVQEVLKELETQSGGLKAEIRIEELPDCTGDYALLKQVWVNLLSNAIKFTRRCNKPLIEIGSLQQGTERVYFVKDNGAGFNQQQAAKLFGVFQRFHSEEQFEGTGVGLSIVHRIVQRHGGRIWAESAVGQGATFYFTVPG